ncbi:hypothetical protein [Deinococcus sp. Marseille-Q6407]|uniref:hypothetical protein n=1 Tax=Deinococcus sp. Marseille-Q6407 TaxID=2969223 RepID=UPI0021BF53DE|nr:hypothetical protein [Deinococcus sp. Marseille-Q6407]
MTYTAEDSYWGQIGLRAVVSGPDASGSWAYCNQWAVVKAYHQDRDLYTIRLERGLWIQVSPANLLVAAAPLVPVQGVRA